MEEIVGKYFINNGKLTDISEFDLTLLTGKSYIYEVFRVIEGVPLFLDDHLERLEQTCTLSGIVAKADLNQTAANVYEVINSNYLSTGNIKIVLTASSLMRWLIYITGHMYPTPEQNQSGVAVALQRATRSNPNAKILDAQMREAANIIKTKMNVYETILIDNQGYITEGSRSNVFFVRNNTVITPPIKDVLPGVTRKHVINVCDSLGIKVSQERILARSLVTMEGVFITGTSRMVLPVNKIDNLDFDAAHPAIRLIKDKFAQYVNHYIAENRLQPKTKA